MAAFKAAWLQRRTFFDHCSMLAPATVRVALCAISLYGDSRKDVETAWHAAERILSAFLSSSAVGGAYHSPFGQQQAARFLGESSEAQVGTCRENP